MLGRAVDVLVDVQPKQLDALLREVNGGVAGLGASVTAIDWRISSCRWCACR